MCPSDEFPPNKEKPKGGLLRRTWEGKGSNGNDDHAIYWRRTYRTAVAREFARNKKKKGIVGRRDYTLSTDKQRLSLTETNSVAVWARATFAGRSNTFCASPRHRRQNHPRRAQRTGAHAILTTGLSFFARYYISTYDTISKTAIKTLNTALKPYNNSQYSFVNVIVYVLN